MWDGAAGGTPATTSRSILELSELSATQTRAARHTTEKLTAWLDELNAARRDDALT